MTIIQLKNQTGRPYEDVRDEICKSLVGCEAFINNDIIVSDDLQKGNMICITLGETIGDDDIIVDGTITKSR